MTLNEIIKKLSQKNQGANLLFGLSVCFAVAMVGAYGILLFSPIITNVLMTDGSTYIISLGMYVITMIGIIVFILYANGIYIRFQMEETGVLLSLGLRPKAVIKIRNQQLDKVYLVSGAVGLVLAVPISFCFWSFLTLFLSYTDHTFAVGWKGLLLAGVLWIIIWMILRCKNTVQLSKLDVIKILRSSSQCEEVKGSHPAFGVVGLLIVPTGLILFNITATIVSLKSFSVIFLGVSVIGIYMIAAQITSIARIVKRFFPTVYRKKILFYNLVKQKGNQYTLSLFVSSLLITLTIFSICFNGCSFLEMHYKIKEDPYDYAVLLIGKQKEFGEVEICSLAKENNINVTECKTLDLLLIGREHQYADRTRNEWSPEFAVSESAFYKLSGVELSVQDDSYVYFQDSDDSMFQTCTEENGVFYNPTTQDNFVLKKGELLNRANILNRTATISSFAILNDRNFSEISENLDSMYKLTYYLFNGNNPQNSGKFQQKLLEEIVVLSDGKIFDNYQEQAIKNKLIGYEAKIIPYEGNELYAARWWDSYPYARNTELSIQMEAGVVYLLLVFFISIITFVSASMIMGIKIAGTILQDKESYKRAMYLGLKEKDLKMVIKKQIGLIYFFPTISGCITATFMINRFMITSSVTHVFEVTMMAIFLSLAVFLLQYIIFFFLQRKLVASTAKLVYESR